MSLFGAIEEHRRDGKRMFFTNIVVPAEGVLLVKTPFKKIFSVFYSIESPFGLTQPPTSALCTFGIEGSIVQVNAWKLPNTPPDGPPGMPNESEPQVLVLAEEESKISLIIVGFLR